MDIEAGVPAIEVQLSGKLGERTLPMQVLSLAIWPLLEQILTFLVGLTDILIAGRMGTDADRVAILDAMALGGYIAWFIYIFQGAVATGALAVVSRAVGARDFKIANRGLGQGFWLGLGAGVTALVLLLLGAGHVVHWMNLGAKAAVYAEQFIRTLAWSAPVAGMVFAVNAALRGAGDTRTPFFTMLIVNVFNVLSSIYFVFGDGPWADQGIEGIAMGTICGWVAGFVFLVFYLLLRKKSIVSWCWDGLKIHCDQMLRIWKVGVPQAIEIGVMWSIHAFGIRIISNLENEGALGAHFIAIRLESMSFLLGFAIAAAAATLTGQYLGAGSKPMAVKAVRFSWKITVALMAILGLLFYLNREFLVTLIAPESHIHAELAAPLLMVCAFAQPFFATCIILKSSMRGAGATKMVMRAAFSSMILFRIVALYALSLSPYFSLFNIWLVLSLDILTQAVIFSWLHFRGKWLDTKV